MRPQLTPLYGVRLTFWVAGRWGEPMGGKCPRLKKPRRGTWSVYVNVPASGAAGRGPIRKGGFGSKGKAEAWASTYLRARLDGARLVPAKQTGLLKALVTLPLRPWRARISGSSQMRV